jgi:hypothetical protein
MRNVVIPLLLLPACGGGSDVVCGEGTVEHDGVCRPSAAGDSDADTDADDLCAEPDADGDEVPRLVCGGDDCDDRDPEIHPGVDDPFGDGVDQDCGGVDGVDEDADGHAQSPGDDCDDASALVHPGAPDPDGDCLDEDCNGQGGPDEDGDGFDATQCHGDDCDDGDPVVNRAAADPLGDGVDTNCDGIDGEDLDGDGHPSIESGGDDCDDGHADTHPGAVDLFGDDVDQDCAGSDGVDLDLDGHASRESGGDDCDDTEAAVHPDVVEDEAWTIETVDSDGETGHYASIALDGDVPHIGYLDGIPEEWGNVIRHAWNPLGVWVIDAVADVTPGYPNLSLAVHDGMSHLVWYDNYPSDLMHGTDDPFAWAVETVEDTGGQTGFDPSIAIDDAGTLHVVYVDGSASLLRYARQEAGTWTFETIEAGACGFAGFNYCQPDVAVEGDVVHVVYTDADEIVYERREAGVWTSEVALAVDIAGGGVGPRSAHVVAEGGVVHVAFWNYSDGQNVEYLSRDGDVWSDPDVVHFGGASNGIDVEGGVVHVLYTTSDVGGVQSLEYATNARGAWDRETVETVVHQNPSIAVGPDFVHVAYYVVADADLRYARRGRPDGVDSDCDGAD